MPTNISAEFGADPTKPYKIGGKNKIIWGGAVEPGTSGGNTSYNPETGQVQYIAGYENDAVAASAAPTAASPTKSSKPKAKQTAKTSAPVQGLRAAAAPSAPSAVPAPTPIPTPTSAPTPAPEDLLSSQIIRAPQNTAPVEGPGGGGIGGGTPGVNGLMGQGPMRQGIGQRTLPQYNAILAGLGRAY